MEGAKELGGRCSVLQAELSACRAQVFALETELQRSRGEQAIAVDSAQSRLTEAAQALKVSHSEFMKMVAVVKRNKGRLRAMKQQISAYDDMLSRLGQVSRDLIEEKAKSNRLESIISELNLQVSELKDANHRLESSLHEKEKELESVGLMRDEHWRRLQSVSEEYQAVLHLGRGLDEQRELSRVVGYRRYLELASALKNILISAVLIGTTSSESKMRVDRNILHLDGQRFKFDQVREVNDSSQLKDSFNDEMDFLVHMAFEGQHILVMNYGYVSSVFLIFAYRWCYIHLEFFCERVPSLEWRTRDAPPSL